MKNSLTNNNLLATLRNPKAPKEFQPLKDQTEAFSKEIILERLMKDEEFYLRKLYGKRPISQEERTTFKGKLRDTRREIKKTFDEADSLWRTTNVVSHRNGSS
jgi:hypothetical protein